MEQHLLRNSLFFCWKNTWLIFLDQFFLCCILTSSFLDSIYSTVIFLGFLSPMIACSLNKSQEPARELKSHRMSLLECKSCLLREPSGLLLDGMMWKANKKSILSFHQQHQFSLASFVTGNRNTKIKHAPGLVGCFL